MFVGRVKELKDLEEAYRSEKGEFVILYGRRRIGKTNLLVEFCKDKNTFFYTAKECSDRVQLQDFSRQVLDFFHCDFSSNAFDSWQSVFDFIAHQNFESKIVLVVDEFPYMAKSNRSILSILQSLWDLKFSLKNIMLILSGSSLSFMEEEVLGAKTPLFGRATLIINLKALSFFRAAKFFPIIQTKKSS